ncbi:MAG: hypothetical protein Q8P67_06560 [archaeon]|nr:hypothetical protein [archaeon]
MDSRKRYISETNRTLSSINRALQQGGPASRSGGSGGSGSGGRAADRHALLGDGGQRRDTKDRLEAELVAENDAFLQQQEQAQRDISSQRDLVLDDLSANITEIGEMGRAIGSELDIHIDILEGLNADAETTEGRIGRGMKRIGELIDKSSNTSVIIVIVILVLILVGITAMLFV